MFKRGRRHPNIYRDQESGCSREAEDIQTHIGTKREDVQERQKRGRRHPNIYRDQESGCSREAEDIQTYIGTKRVDVQERQKTSKYRD